MDDDQILAANARLRRDIADLLETLTPAQLDTPSLCDGWTVREVGGHLTAAVSRSPLALVAQLPRAGFRIHRANELLGRQVASVPVAELADTLRRNAGKRFKPPVVGARGPLTDLLVHGGDIRLPLGMDLDPDADQSGVVMDFLASCPPGFVPKSRLRGLRLVATDLDRTWGDGDEVRGRAADLMMALCGRTYVLDRLTGAGVPALTERITRRHADR